jgi:hypothetical protein
MTERLHHVADKKGQILSKILRVNSAPDTSVIATMQDRLNNPLFKLSIADYELMCGNKMLLKMMAKTLKRDEKQLKKFCKYINVFKENINSSPKSIRNKMKPTSSIIQLPDNILGKIVEKYKELFPVKYVLRRWIPLNELAWNSLSRNTNPKAVELLKENMDKIYWDLLSANPAAIELLREKIEDEKDIDEDDLNDLESEDKISWRFLSANPNAIQLLEENYENIDWKMLSENPNAIKLLKENPKKIYWRSLSANKNPEAIELLKTNKENIDWKVLSANPNTKAIELLKLHEDQINWSYLSANPNTKAIELLKSNPKKIDWGALSKNMNPVAIELLKEQENEDKIHWVYLSENPNAFDLLMANPKKIDWGGLSRNTNPKVIDLLEEKPHKIKWVYLSANPIIFEEVSSEYSIEKYQNNSILLDSYAKVQDIVYIPINTEAKNKELIKSLFSKPIKYEAGLDKLKAYFQNTSVSNTENVYVNYYHDILREINAIIAKIYSNNTLAAAMLTTRYQWNINYKYDPFAIPKESPDIDTVDAIVITKQILDKMWKNTQYQYQQSQELRSVGLNEAVNDEFKKIIMYSENNKNQQDINRNLEINMSKYLALQFIFVLMRNNNDNPQIRKTINKDILILDALITKNIVFNNDNSVSVSKSISWSGTPNSNGDDLQAKATKEKYKVTKADLLKEILENNLNDSDPFMGEEWADMPLNKLKKVISITSTINGTTYRHAFYVRTLYQLWRASEKSSDGEIKFVNPYNRVPFTEDDKKAIMDAMITIYPKLERPIAGNGRKDISYQLSTDGYSFSHFRFHYILKVPDGEDILILLANIYLRLNYDVEFDTEYIPNVLFENINYLVENKKMFGKKTPIKMLDVLEEYNDKYIITMSEYKVFFDKIKNAL